MSRTKRGWVGTAQYPCFSSDDSGTAGTAAFFHLLFYRSRWLSRDSRITGWKMREVYSSRRLIYHLLRIKNNIIQPSLSTIR